VLNWKTLKQYACLCIRMKYSQHY